MFGPDLVPVPVPVPVALEGEKPSRLKRLCTQELLLLLERSPSLEPVLEEHGESMDGVSFSGRLNALMEERSISTSRLSELALLSRSFTYQLCSGVRAPSRDIVLRLALVLSLTVEEAQRLLLTAQRGALYPRVRRDAVMIFAISHQLSLFDTDELLRSLGEGPLL